MAVVAPLLRLLLTHPVWLAQQVDAYASLGRDQAALAVRSLRRQAWLMALALLFGTAGVVLSGVALMLWSLTAALPMAQPWILLAIPTTTLLIAALLYVLGVQQSRVAVLEPLRRRWALDTLHLQASAPPAGPWSWVVLAAQLADHWLRARAAHPPAAPPPAQATAQAPTGRADGPGPDQLGSHGPPGP